MIIFVTDVGRYWNHKNPILEKYADCVTVVCVNGKKVTDKYRCIVSPYKEEVEEKEDYSILSTKYKALKSIQGDLREAYCYHDNILFLADNEPQSLYPYLVLKNDEEYNKMHLWCMSPWEEEGNKRKSEYYELLHDLSKLTSLLYVDSKELKKQENEKKSMQELQQYCAEWFASMLPGVIYEIESKMRWTKCYYYDFGINRYIQVENSYENILKAKPLDEKKVNEFILFQKYTTLGLLRIPEYPNPNEEVKDAVVRLQPRLDGKQVCEELKKLRKSLAKANNIKYEPVECPSKGPCAGTCQQCDMEIRYLQKQLRKKEEEQRVYPKFAIQQEPLRKEKNFDNLETSNEILQAEEVSDCE